MTRDEILAFVPHLPDCRTNFGALNYAVPTLKWVQGPFYDFFIKRRWNATLGTWQRRYECRDFVRAYCADMVECWALDNHLSDDDSIAVGEIWFSPTPQLPGSAGHAVASLITDQGLVFLDPQNNKLWPMSPAQFASRFFSRW